MKLVVITGPDASGKDTQVQHLLEHFQKRGLSAQSFSIHSSLVDFVGAVDIKSVNQVLDVFLLKFEPLARTLFLQALLRNSVAKVSRELDIAIFNAYWHKYAASEAAYGVPLAHWTSFSSEFLPRPDLLIELSIAPDSCLLRRSHWSPYESGEGKYVGKKPNAAGIELTKSFQRSMHLSLQSVLQPLKRKIILADQPENKITQQIILECENIGVPDEVCFS